MMIFNPRDEEFQRQVKKYIYLTRKDAIEKDSFYYKDKKEKMFEIFKNYNNNKKNFLEEVETNENYSKLLEFCKYFNKLIIDLRKKEKRKGNSDNNIRTEREILEIIKKKLIINLNERSSIQHGQWLDERGYFYHSNGLNNRKNALINLIKEEDAALAEALKDISVQNFEGANASLKKIQEKNKDKLNIVALGKYLQQDKNGFFVFPDINDGIVWEELFRVSLCHYLGIGEKNHDIVESLGQQLYSYFNEDGEEIASGQSNKIDVRLGDLGLSLKNFQLQDENFNFITKQDIENENTPWIKSYNRISIISPKQFLKMIIGIEEMRTEDYMSSALLNGVTYDTKIINNFQPLKDIILLESLTGSMQLSGAARVLVLRNKRTGFFSVRPMNKVMKSNISKDILKEYFRGGIKFNKKEELSKVNLFDLYVERKNKIIESQKEGSSVNLIGNLNNKEEEIQTIT